MEKQLLFKSITKWTLTIIFGLLALHTYGQQLDGPPISGEHRLNLGRATSISADGNTIAVTTYHLFGNSQIERFTGSVRVYQKQSRHNSFFWIQIGDAIEETTYTTDGTTLAQAISLSNDGSRLAVGNKDYIEDTTRCPPDQDISVLENCGVGRVRVFEKEADPSVPGGFKWVQIGSDILGKQAGEKFGLDVSLSGDGNSVLVGAPFHDRNGTTGAGRAQMYTIDGSNNWNPRPDGEIYGQSHNELLGSNVSISDDGNTWAVVSLNLDDSTATAFGGGGIHVEAGIYEYDNGSLNLTANLIGDPSHVIRNLGGVVQLTGDGKALVISWSDTVDFTHTPVRVYKKNMTNEWVRSDNDEFTGELGFGVALSDDAKTLVIGEAFFSPMNISAAGRVFIYKYESNSWQLATTLTGEHLGNTLGKVNTLSLSSNGSTLLMGEPTHGIDNAGFNTSAGRVRVFNIATSEVSIEGAPSRINTTDPFEVSFAFDNPVSDFEIGDISLSNATVDNFTTVNASTYTATITPTAICSNGDITIKVPAGSATNVSSNLSILTAKEVVVETGVVAAAKDITVQLSANGLATIEPEDIDNGSGNGGCNTTVSLSLDRDTFDCNDVGSPITVTLTATSGGRTDIATAVVTVENNINNLTAIAKDITVQLDANGLATINPGQIDNGSGSGCNSSGSIFISLDRNTFTCNDVGSPVTVALTVTQGNNLRTATALVTVEENPDGLVAIAKDITVQLDANGQATITPEQLNNGSSYGCGNSPILSLDRDTFSCNDTGTPVTVTLTATQGNNSDAATALVTVQGNPNDLVAIAKDITVLLDANGQVTISPDQVNNGSSSGCNNNLDLSLDRDTFDCSDVGTPVTVTLTASQGNNSNATTAMVTVEESLDVIAIAKDITVQLNANGQATITPEQLNNGSFYGCNNNSPNLSLDIDTFTCNDVGSPVTVSLTATQGNSSNTATALVTVENTINDLVAVAKDITVQLDANGQATINPGQIDNGSGSGCNSSSSIFISLDRNTFTCNDVGFPVTVVLTATQGNATATATAQVTVQEHLDNLAAKAKDITVQLDANGQVTITPEQLDNGSSGGGCNNNKPTLSLDRNTFTCDDVGSPVTVTLTATQGTNTVTATAMVTVEATTGNCEFEPLVDFNRGFSPNADGIGDNLVIEGLEAYGNNVVKIYDLSQRLLFSAHYGGPGDGWDGTHKGGRVPVGSYVCVIDYNEPGLGHEAKMIYVNY